MGDELWNDNPGPGAYCVKDKATTTQAPIYTIGKKLNFDDDGALPGPGTYSPSFHDAGPSYSLPARLPDLSKDDSMPGPGAYSSHTRFTQSCPPAYSIAVRLGDAASSKNNPGPGTYTPHLTPGGPSFSLRARSASDGALDRDNPGPGSYDPHVHNCIPAYSLGKRLGDAGKDENPGPGAYETQGKRGGPAFTMRGRLDHVGSVLTANWSGAGCRRNWRFVCNGG